MKTKTKPPQRNVALIVLRMIDIDAWRAQVRDALRANNGNVTHAAKALQINRSTLSRWITDNATLTKGIALAPRGYHGHLKPKGATP